MPPGFGWERCGDDWMIFDESGDRHIASYHEHILILQVEALRHRLSETVSRESQLHALVRWAYELTERALWLKGHAARVALIKAAADINNRFKEFAR